MESIGTAHTGLSYRTTRRASETNPGAKGFQSLSVLDGGVDAWKTGGKQLTVAANKPWSMERQVRVAAGSLVLTFFGLGLFTSKKLFVGAALVGAGLVYAGVSDNCMMASVLEKMPWNDPDRAKV